MDQRGLIVDNIGLPARTYNFAFGDGTATGMNDGTIQVALKEGHAPTADYVAKLRQTLPAAFPEDIFYFQAADMVTQILNFGIPAQIDVRTVGYDRAKNLEVAKKLRDAIAKVTWDRDSTLVNKGRVTAQQGDTDRLNLQARDAAVAVVQANVTAQEAQLRALQQQKDYQSVTAPFDGVITQRNIDIGALVQADATSGTFLFTLMQAEVIRIQLYVPQDEALGIASGVAVVHVPEMPDREFPGTVTRIADALAPGTRTLLTEIDIPNHDRALAAGLYCNVELKIPRKTPSLMVPSEAVIFNRNGLSVAVVESGVVHFHKITVARDFGTHIEVSAGVRDGDRVVLDPAVDLADGHRVTVREPPRQQQNVSAKGT
jgi:RND family efflux transporter MFP subunit